jgi:hypothetical protein
MQVPRGGAPERESTTRLKTRPQTSQAWPEATTQCHLARALAIGHWHSRVGDPNGLLPGARWVNSSRRGDYPLDSLPSIAPRPGDRKNTGVSAMDSGVAPHLRGAGPDIFSCSPPELPPGVYLGRWAGGSEPAPQPPSPVPSGERPPSARRVQEDYAERGTRVAVCTALQIQVYLGRWEGGQRVSTAAAPVRVHAEIRMHVKPTKGVGANLVRLNRGGCIDSPKPNGSLGPARPLYDTAAATASARGGLWIKPSHGRIFTGNTL